MGLCGLFLHDKHHFVHVRIITALNEKTAADPVVASEELVVH
jgi:hypothetical protein